MRSCTRCPGARASGWPWRGRSCTTRTCCSSTSRSPAWTRHRPPPCRRCSSGRAGRWSSPPTTPSAGRPSRSGSWSSSTDGSARHEPVNNVRKMFLLAAKDLQSEARAREIAPPMVLFGLILVFLFTLDFPPGAGRAPVPGPVVGAVGSRELAGAFLWVSLLFAGILGFGRNASTEREGNRIEGLLLAPVDPAALFAGKALANFCYLWML